MWVNNGLLTDPALANDPLRTYKLDLDDSEQADLYGAMDHFRPYLSLFGNINKQLLLVI